MKKTILFIIVLIIIILGIQFFDFKTSDEDEPQIVEETPNLEVVEKGFNPMLIEAIESYLILQPELAWQTKDGSSNMCVFENLEPQNELFPLSLWVKCSEYIVSGDGEVEKLSGASLPLLLDYPNELSYYNLEKMTHIVPRDGSFYSEDIKKMFLEEVQAKIFSVYKSDIGERLEMEMDKKLDGSK